MKKNGIELFNRANIIAYFEIYFKRDGIQKNLDDKIDTITYSLKTIFIMHINNVSIYFNSVKITKETLVFFINKEKVALIFLQDIDKLERIN